MEGKDGENRYIVPSVSVRVSTGDYNKAYRPYVQEHGAKHLIGPLQQLGGRIEGFEKKGQAWFVATELQSDLVVDVDGIKFNLHKFPLLSRSGRLNRLVFESRDTESDFIKLEDLPGGPETFELAARFCYGMEIDVNASNVAPLRCAAEYLEMTDDLEEGNLISKTETFLTFVALASWKDSIAILKSCENLAPLAESLQLVRRCSESIAWKASTDIKTMNWASTDIKTMNWAAKDNVRRFLLSNGQDISKSSFRQNWWFDDVSMLKVDHFMMVMLAIKVKGIRSDILGAVIMQYALKWIPGLMKESEWEEKEQSGMQMATSLGKDGFTMFQSKTRRMIEDIVSILPSQHDCVPCDFLFRLLRLANMHRVNSACIMDLERRAGMHLDHASAEDLLIPAFFHSSETLYDVDLVLRLVQQFLQQDLSSPSASSDYDPNGDSLGKNPKCKMAKILDVYLAEVARDSNLPLPKFQALVEAIPESLRASCDGLYRAIDTFLKAHAGLSQDERKALCRSINCNKLSADACLHASQNERLPVRTSIEVLFSELFKVKSAIASSMILKEPQHYCNENDDDAFEISHHNANYMAQPMQDAWKATQQEVKSIRQDIEHIMSKFTEFQSDYSYVRQQMEKLSITPRQLPQPPPPPKATWLGKKFKRVSTIFGREGIDDGTRSATAPPEARHGVQSTPAVQRSRRWRNSVS